MYAITDIETTGSYPADNGITEIAIVLHNGKEVEGRFETLINPKIKVPPFITHLTGISNEMLHNAPVFEDVADRIFSLLHNRIFVAHNVNFDYSFIKYHLQTNGYEWNAKKLCTLKLSRKAFPGYTKYGLGSICRQLNIEVENRHRAGGDADATAVLFSKIVEQGGDKLIQQFLKKENHEQILPPNTDNEQVNRLPYAPGVYYFHDAKGKVIYVGKAKVLKRRVLSHFTGLNTGSKRQEFLRNIHSVSFAECPTEFTAALFESIEIKRLWPSHNISQKNFEKQFGIYSFEDSNGYMRLAIDRKKKYLQPVATFGLMSDAHRTLWKLVKNHELHPALCFLDSSKAAIQLPEKETYNARVNEALDAMQLQSLTYAIVEPAAFGSNYSCVLIENGKFYGMGVIASPHDIYNLEKLKKKLSQHPENEVIKSLIRNYGDKHPSKVYLVSK